MSTLPPGAILYSSRTTSDSIARRIDVYQLPNGGCLIRKIMPNGRKVEWQHEKSAADWTAFNNGPRTKAVWVIHQEPAR